MRADTRPSSGMGARFALIAALGVLFGACTESSPRVVQELPELPADLANNLEAAQTAPVLMTKPLGSGELPESAKSSTGTLPLAPNKACTKYYDGYVTYPITVCYPPFNLSGLKLAAALERRAKPELESKFYKLTSPALASVRGGPWFCTVRSGPWYAHVEGQQICGANPNIRSFRADILGAPQTVVVNWVGAITDVPMPLVLVGVTETSEQCVCCSGVLCPDQTCKPNPNLCGGGGSPAFK